MSGYSASEVINHNIKQIYSSSALAVYQQALHKLESRGFVGNLEFEFQTKSSRVKTALLSMELINLGKTKCTLQILNDITERKRLENEFISLVSHELRTPMTFRYIERSRSTNSSSSHPQQRTCDPFG